MTQSAIIVPLIGYLILVYILAAYANRILSKSDNFLEEYFIGSRNMGGFVLAMTLVATYASASSFIGGPGVAYKMGLGWVLLAMIQLPAAWLSLSVLGKKYAIIARRINAVTINDILRARYNNKWVVIFGSLALVIFFIAAMVAQFVGGARLFEGMTGLSYNTGLIIFASTVVLYTTIGGFRAVALTDAVQGVVMMIGTTALLFGVIKAGGGIPNLIESLHAVDPALITPAGPNGFLSKPFILSFWVLVCFGVIGIPHTAVRCFGYKDSRAMHRAIIVGTFVLGFLMLGMHLCGAFGRVIVPGLTVGDKIMPALTLKVLPPVFAGIFLAGPLAAIMSTIDSQLILASATIVKDLYINYVKKEGHEPSIEPDQKQETQSVQRLSFITTAILGLIVFGASFNPPDLIVWLNLFAFGGLQAAFLWPLILGLYWKRANAYGAMAAMAVGVGSYFYFATFIKRVAGMHVIVPVLAITLGVFVLVSLLTPKPDEATLDLFWGTGKSVPPAAR
ncbi:sodium/panthothenate symporter [Desulfoluna limicola]|uniref:Sodium/panthothenate symporter n=1 Tax=Desulfoluna limicola TaxID=2810562 RepID=A0ABN6F2Q7_9BACT|nr:sodium/pantothenate symporter [Desulfoluna limicola]BCS95830.1 sodium/panthothenate symporter [Desulfoluna limicola]